MSIAHVEREHHDGVPVVHVTGEVDTANARTVSEKLLSAVSNEAPGLVVDLAGTRYMDSAGLGMLFELHDRLATRRQALQLVVPDDTPVRRILTLVGMEGTVPVHATLAAALDELTGGERSPLPPVPD
jgi:anti-anti-sigma factor